MMMQMNQQFDLAFNFLQNTGTHLFLTGKAGTGKTTFLKKLKEVSPKRMIVVAPTGVAAILAQVRHVDKDIGIAVGKHLCYIRAVAIRQKLFVNLTAAYDESIVTAVLFDNRFYAVNNLRTVALEIFVGRKYNIFSIFKRFCVRKTLQRLSAHNHRFTHCFLFKKSHIL